MNELSVILNNHSACGCAKTPIQAGLIKSVPGASSRAISNALCALDYSDVEPVMLNCFMQ